MLTNFGERVHFTQKRLGEGQKAILRVGVKLKIKGESLISTIPHSLFLCQYSSESGNLNTD